MSIESTYNSTLFDRTNTMLLLVDFQPKMIKGVQDWDANEKLDSAVAVAKAAQIADVPVVFTSIDEKDNGKFYKNIRNIFPYQNIIERKIPGFNAFDDKKVKKAIKNTNKPNIIVAGLWTSMCAAFTAIALKDAGYQVYGLMDACGDSSKLSHKYGIQRMTQAGIIPVTWMPVVSAWMNNWADPIAKEMTTEVFDQMK